MKYAAVILSIVFAICALSPTLSAQKSYDDYKKELRKEKGSRYLSLAFEGAEAVAKTGDYKNAIKLMDDAIKKARGMSSNTAAVVTVNKAHLMARLFPKEDVYMMELLEELNKGLGSNPPQNLLDKGIAICEMIRYKCSDRLNARVERKILELGGVTLRKEQEKIAEAKESDLKAFKKLDTEEAYDQLQQLKAERERLENMQEMLSQSVEEKKEELDRHAQQIRVMSRDQARAEAVMQYNQRMIDSLKFLAVLDSINLLNNQNLITQQETRLQLQESEIQLKNSELQLKNSQQKLYLAFAALGLIITGFLSWMFYNTKKTNIALEVKNQIIEEEKERSEALLLNILPQFIAQELKEKEKVTTRMIDNCTVLFTDFINFSQISKKLSPKELIDALDECFRAFDNIITKHNIEKIKTIGDSYMCAGGVPIPNKTHAIDAVNAAYDMVSFLDDWNEKREVQGLMRFDARIGIHSGPIIAGVVGLKKFAYDIWGDTVNVAARMENKSAAQKINISHTTYQLIKDHYLCEKRGSISVKNMKDLRMYFVDQPLKKAQLN